ncbi:MAG TPA: hypothetical protein VIX20_11470, partial [Ktedonobacteraceae bacterium]
NWAVNGWYPGAQLAPPTIPLQVGLEKGKIWLQHLIKPGSKHNVANILVCLLVKNCMVGAILAGKAAIKLCYATSPRH